VKENSVSELEEIIKGGIFNQESRDFGGQMIRVCKSLKVLTRDRKKTFLSLWRKKDFDNPQELDSHILGLHLEINDFVFTLATHLHEFIIRNRLVLEEIKDSAELDRVKQILGRVLPPNQLRTRMTELEKDIDDNYSVQAKGHSLITEETYLLIKLRELYSEFFSENPPPSGPLSNRQIIGSLAFLLTAVDFWPDQKDVQNKVARVFGRIEKRIESKDTDKES
jgi:hypothetical protein